MIDGDATLIPWLEKVRDEVIKDENVAQVYD
jgi:hypothetical protein